MSYTVVASTVIQTNDTSSVTTSAIDTTGADLIFAVEFGQPGITVTVSDSKSNTWTARTQYGSPSGPRYNVRPFDCRPTSVGTGHTFTCTGSGLYSTFIVVAVSGSVASPFDQQNGGVVASGDTTIPTGSITPTVANEIIFACFGIDDPTNTGTPAFSVDSGFTILQTGDVVPGATYGGVLAYKIQTTAAAVNPTLTRSNANTQAGDTATILSYKAASGGAAVVEQSHLLLLGCS